MMLAAKPNNIQRRAVIRMMRFYLFVATNPTRQLNQLASLDRIPDLILDPQTITVLLPPFSFVGSYRPRMGFLPSLTVRLALALSRRAF